MLEPKEAVSTPVPFPSPGDECSDLGDSLRLSWVLIDSEGRRAMNLSSAAPVSIQRHWLSGEVHARFATILSSGERGKSQFCPHVGQSGLGFLLLIHISSRTFCLFSRRRK
ncbi:hypothetical protein ACJRO7_016809 [Eucalyptus globulus]|uniref:Uncharacterized protein n=1 Tax=Eucalyptus globulus TaxID=34317 RepID=A0ABD3KV96_EUCGL